jgi:hypothetical protein
LELIFNCSRIECLLGYLDVFQLMIASIIAAYAVGSASPVPAQGAAASAAPQVATDTTTYDLKRKYKVNESDRYESIIEITGQYSAIVRSTALMTVKKIYSNGDADIETKPEKATAVVMGQAGPVQLPKPFVSRFNAYGLEIKSSRGIAGIPNFMRFAALSGRDALKIGEEVAVEDKSDEGNVTGKFKLTQVVDGVANVRGDLLVSTKAQANPYTLQIESYITVADGKAKVTAGIVSGFVADPGTPKVDQIKFTVTRIK